MIKLILKKLRWVFFRLFQKPERFFVHGGKGNDANDGKSPETALATLREAIEKASYGSVIYVQAESPAEMKVNE